MFSAVITYTICGSELLLVVLQLTHGLQNIDTSWLELPNRKFSS